MKKWFFLFVMAGVLGCTQSNTVEEPKDLIPPKKMAELIADFAINNQMGYLNPQGDMEAHTRSILDRHKVTATRFSESYNYYLSMPNTLEGILEDAQDLIKDRDPDAEAYIDKKSKENSSVMQGFEGR